MRSMLVRDRGHHRRIRGSVKEDVIFVNTYAPSLAAPKHIKLTSTDIKGEAAVLGDVDAHLPPWIEHPDSKLETRAFSDALTRWTHSEHSTPNLKSVRPTQVHMERSPK